jgi:hypothetical protein
LLKPLDLQTIITRSGDVQRIQQIQNSRPHIEQQQFSHELRRQMEERQTMVEQTAVSTEEGKIRDNAAADAFRQSTRRYRRFFGKKDPKNAEEPEQPTLENGTGQHIDIKI